MLSKLPHYHAADGNNRHYISGQQFLSNVFSNSIQLNKQTWAFGIGDIWPSKCSEAAGPIMGQPINHDTKWQQHARKQCLENHKVKTSTSTLYNSSFATYQIAKHCFKEKESTKCGRNWKEMETQIHWWLANSPFLLEDNLTQTIKTEVTNQCNSSCTVITN